MGVFWCHAHAPAAQGPFITRQESERSLRGGLALSVAPASEGRVGVVASESAPPPGSRLREPGGGLARWPLPQKAGQRWCLGALLGQSWF